jgi:hypothetical protein
LWYLARGGFLCCWQYAVKGEHAGGLLRLFDWLLAEMGLCSSRFLPPLLLQLPGFDGKIRRCRRRLLRPNELPCSRLPRWAGAPGAGLQAHTTTGQEAGATALPYIKQKRYFLKRRRAAILSPSLHLKTHASTYFHSSLTEPPFRLA